MEKKDLRFEIKAVGEDGTFEGFLSVYGVVDYGNDLVERGAFKKTITDTKGVVPMLWQHDEKQPIGSLELEDREDGLFVRGRFLLEVEKAREAYALVKANIIRGLSIGYRAVQKQVTKGIRHLSEIQLFEGSVVTFPMNPAALIATVKAALGERKEDFVTELDRIRLNMTGWMLTDALQRAIYSAVYEEDGIDATARIEMAGTAIDQFRAAYMEYLPQYLTMMGEMEPELEMDSRKAGRRLSSSSRTQIEEAISKLQALLMDDASTSTEAAEVESLKAATPANEPDALHSWLQSFKSQLKAAA